MAEKPRRPARNRHTDDSPEEDGPTASTVGPDKAQQQLDSEDTMVRLATIHQALAKRDHCRSEARRLALELRQAKRRLADAEQAFVEVICYERRRNT